MSPSWSSLFRSLTASRYLMLVSLTASTAQAGKTPPSTVEWSGDVEMSTSLVTRDTRPDRKFLMTVITVLVREAGGKPPRAYVFVVESPADGKSVKHFAAKSKVAHAPNSLRVWDEKLAGWCFLASGASVPPATACEVVRVQKIGRYVVNDASRFSHTETTKILFSGKVKR